MWRFKLPLLGSSRRPPFGVNQDSPDPEGPSEPPEFQQLANLYASSCHPMLEFAGLNARLCCVLFARCRILLLNTAPKSKLACRRRPPRVFAGDGAWFSRRIVAMAPGGQNAIQLAKPRPDRRALELAEAANHRHPLRTAALERPAYFSMTRTTPSAFCGRIGPAK